MRRCAWCRQPRVKVRIRTHRRRRRPYWPHMDHSGQTGQSARPRGGADASQTLAQTNVPKQVDGTQPQHSPLILLLLAPLERSPRLQSPYELLQSPAPPPPAPFLPPPRLVRPPATATALEVCALEPAHRRRTILPPKPPLRRSPRRQWPPLRREASPASSSTFFDQVTSPATSCRPLGRPASHLAFVTREAYWTLD